MLKEIWNDIHMKWSTGQVIAVDDFCSIYKATIFSAEQMIFGIEASRFVESLRLINYFVSDVFEFHLNLLELKLPSAVMDKTLTPSPWTT